MKSSFLCLIILFALAHTTYAQQSYNVLDWKANTTLYKYITQKLHAQYVSRDSMFQHALDHKTLPAYQEYCRKNYSKILGLPAVAIAQAGAFPQKTPLNVRITGTIQRNGYSIKKVIYESFPGHHVTANLYIPDGEGPFPGILFFCGHEATSKATLTYQQTAIRFAKNGFVVLSIDPISQGERYQLTDPLGKPLTRGGTTAHTILASGSNLVGTSVVAYELWDNERGLDYLCSLKKVDTSRLGCLGNSGGGTQTAYFIPYDPRIKVAAVCSYITRRERTLLLLGPQDGCQWLPRESKAGLDISDFLIMFAPKPVLILSGRYDFVDFNGTKEVYKELKQVYQQFNQPEKVKLFAYANGHGIQTPKQIAAVKWFSRWLYNDTSQKIKTEAYTLSEQQLNVTKTGQVSSTFKTEKNIPSRNMLLANQWKNHREKLLKGSSHADYQKMLKRVLHIQVNASAIDTQQMGAFKKAGYHFQKLILRRKGEPPLPCFLAYGKNKAAHKLIMVLNKEGKKAAIQNDSLLNVLFKKGDALLLADLRGIGETADDPDKNDKKYYNSEYRNAMLSLFTGMPLPGQRVEDIFTLLDYVKTDAHLQQASVEIQASGPAAEASLFAAALDSHIDKLALSATISSFYEMMQHPLMKDQYSYVIPNALQYFDLPDLIKFIGQERVEYLDHSE